MKGLVKKNSQTSIRKGIMSSVERVLFVVFMFMSKPRRLWIYLEISTSCLSQDVDKKRDKFLPVVNYQGLNVNDERDN